jgi:hypothetical protein
LEDLRIIRRSRSEDLVRGRGSQEILKVRTTLARSESSYDCIHSSSTHCGLLKALTLSAVDCMCDARGVQARCCRLGYITVLTMRPADKKL